MRKLIFSLGLAILGIALLSNPALANQFTGNSYPNPAGFQAFIAVLPIILILVLLFLKVDMLVAGFVGGVIAMLVGGVSLAQGQSLLISSIKAMMGFIVPVVNSAIAMAVFKSGGYSSALVLVRRGIKDKVEYFAAFIVLLMSAATYASGVGGGTAMVLAPLAFAALGAIPEVIAGMCLAGAVAFTTSPASLESSIVAKLTGIANIGDYVSTMRPYWILFTVLAIAIAFFGTKRRGALFQGRQEEHFEQATSKKLFINTIPAIFLLFAVIFGPAVNKLVGAPILGPFMYLIITVALIAICTKYKLAESSQFLVDGSQYILTRLFGVGIFITFIYIIERTGAFNVIVSFADKAPSSMIVPAMVLAGFCIGVPAGAYVGTILTLILPIAVSLQLPLLAIGFITMGVGLGSQMAFVNITMQAQSTGFQIPILQVVKGNSPFILSALVILLVLATILG